MVEARRHVARHFNVLNLIAAHRYFVRLEHQNVGAHQHGVHEQTRSDVGIGIVASQVVFVDRRFVGVCTVQHAFACDAGQKPCEFGNFGNVGLAIEHHAIRVQAGCNPAGGNFQCRTLNARWVIAFDQGVVVGQKVKALCGRIATGLHCGANGAHIVAQVRRACGGDAGKNASALGVVGRHGNGCFKKRALRALRSLSQRFQNQFDQSKRGVHHRVEPQVIDHTCDGQGHHNEKTIRLDARELIGLAPRQQAHHDAATIQGWQGEQVEGKHHHVAQHAGFAHGQEEFFGNAKVGVDHIQQGPHDGLNQIGTRPCQGHPNHVAFGMTQIAKVDRHGLGVAKQQGAAGAEVKQQGQQDGADPMDVRKGIERDASHHVSRAVAKVFGGIAVRSLMQGDRKDHGQGIDRNGLDEVRGVHRAIVSKSWLGFGAAVYKPSRAMSPKPCLTTSMPSPVQSTTVVGSRLQAPASITPAMSFS